MIAIHSVFILKENILFLEEWIVYHMLLGVDVFYLYDNSKVQRSGGCHHNNRHFTCGKVNKYNVNYDKIVCMTDEEMKDYINVLTKKYPNVHIFEWSPTNQNGVVMHNQAVRTSRLFTKNEKK